MSLKDIFLVIELRDNTCTSGLVLGDAVGILLAIQYIKQIQLQKTLFKLDVV